MALQRGHDMQSFTHLSDPEPSSLPWPLSEISVEFSEFRSWLPSFLTGWPWANYLNFLGISISFPLKWSTGHVVWSQANRLWILILTLWPMGAWSGYSAFLNLSFLICRMGVIMVSAPQGECRLSKRRQVKCLLMIALGMHLFFGPDKL